MAQEEWVLVDQVQGQLQAELLKGLLEAQGLRVWLNQEGLAHSYAVVVGTLGLVEIMVPNSEVEQAKQVLKAYYQGDFDDMGYSGPSTGDEPD